MFDELPILVLVPHVDAGDRNKWTGDQDLRPLTDLGRDQAAALAPAIGHVDAVVSSPARRCAETVEPLALASGVKIEFDDGLRELTFVTGHRGWDRWPSDEGWRGQLIACGGLGRRLRAVQRIGIRHRGGRVAVAAHGDLAPLFALLAAGFFGVDAPAPIARGGAYEIDSNDLEEPIKSLGGAPGPSSNLKRPDPDTEASGTRASNARPELLPLRGSRRPDRRN